MVTITPACRTFSWTNPTANDTVNLVGSHIMEKVHLVLVVVVIRNHD